MPNLTSPHSLKHLNRELRILKARKAKATDLNTQKRLEKQIIRIVSDKNKVKRGNRTPKGTGKAIKKPKRG